MVKEIKKLTKKQKDMMGPWAEKWIKIGLSTDPMNFDKAMKGVVGCYKAANLSLARRKIFPVSSPLIGSLAAPLSANIICVFLERKNNSKGKVSNAAKDALNQCIDNTIKIAIDSIKGNKTILELTKGISIYDAVSKSVKKTVIPSVYPILSGMTSKEVEIMFNDKISTKLWWHSWMGGQFWAAWRAFQSFLREVCHLELEPNIELAARSYQMIAESCSYWWPNENFCHISDRPTFIGRNSEGKLHADMRKAIEWPDGWGLYILNGVKVPEWLAITEASNLDPARFAKIRNVEERKEFVRKVGMERIINKLDAKSIDKRGNDEVLEFNLGGTTGKRPFLKMKNPSIGCWHVEPIGKECRTVQQAHNWRASRLKHLKGRDWKPDILT